VSKRTRERDVASELFDSEFERALEEYEHRQGDRGRRIEQKTRQLCRQVQRALNLALAGQFADGALDDVFVIEVSAVAGCGRLVAHVATPASQSMSAALTELRDRTPQLRAIVAGYISRKRAPELSFVVAPFGADAYE
jgi:ribosome-binding factor A